MEAREAAKWLAVFVVILIGHFAYDHFVRGGNQAFGITRSMRGEMVTIQANVVMISSGKGHVFPIFKDPDNQKTIKGVLFRNDDAPEENRLQRELLESKRVDGTTVTVEGKVEIYNDELEIIIGKVY